MQLRSIQEALVQQREPLSFEEHQRLQLRKRLQPRYRIVRLLDKLAFQARATAAGVRLPVLGTKRDRKASAAAVLEARRAHIPAEGDALATPSLVRIGGQQWCGPETVAVSEGEKASEGITAQKAVYGRVETSRDENAPRNDGSLCQYQMNAIQPHLVGRLSSKQLQKHSALLELAAEATGVFDVLSRADYPQYQPVQDTAKLGMSSWSLQVFSDEVFFSPVRMASCMFHIRLCNGVTRNAFSPASPLNRRIRGSRVPEAFFDVSCS